MPTFREATARTVEGLAPTRRNAKAGHGPAGGSGRRRGRRRRGVTRRAPTARRRGAVRCEDAPELRGPGRTASSRGDCEDEPQAGSGGIRRGGLPRSLRSARARGRSALLSAREDAGRAWSVEVAPERGESEPVWLIRHVHGAGAPPSWRAAPTPDAAGDSRPRTAPRRSDRVRRRRMSRRAMRRISPSAHNRTRCGDANPTGFRPGTWIGDPPSHDTHSPRHAVRFAASPRVRCAHRCVERIGAAATDWSNARTSV